MPTAPWGLVGGCGVPCAPGNHVSVVLRTFLDEGYHVFCLLSTGVLHRSQVISQKEVSQAGMEMFYLLNGTKVDQQLYSNRCDSPLASALVSTRDTVSVSFKYSVVYFFLLYAAWVRSRAERPSVSYTKVVSKVTWTGHNLQFQRRIKTTKLRQQQIPSQGETGR